MSSLNKLIKGALTIFSSSMIIAVIAYFLKLILARELSLSDYGLTFSVISLFGLMGIFADLGLNGAIIKFISEYQSKNQTKKIHDSFFTVLILQLSISLIISTVFILFSKLIAIKYLSNISSQLLIKFYAVYFVLSIIISLTKSTFIASLKNHYFAFFEVGQHIIIFTLTYLLLKLNVGIYSFFFAYIVFSIIGVVASFLVLTKVMFKDFKIIEIKYDKKIAKKFLTFGFFILIYNLFNLFFGRLETVLLTIFRSLNEVGIYSAIMPTILAFSNLFSALILVLIPVVSELWTKKNYIELKKNVEKIYTYLLVLIIPVSISLFRYAELIINTLFTNKFLAGVIPFQILTFSIFFIIFSRINVSILTGINKPKTIGNIMIITFILNLIINLIAIPIFGLEGATSTTIISFGLSSLLLYYYVNKELNISFGLTKLVKLIFSYGLFGFCLFYASKIIPFSDKVGALVSVGVSFLIYLVSIFVLNIIDLKEEMKLIGK